MSYETKALIILLAELTKRAASTKEVYDCLERIAKAESIEIVKFEEEK